MGSEYPEKTEINVSQVDIYERVDEDGESYWMVDPPGGLHDTAAKALEWVKSRSDRTAKIYGISSATVVTWHPATRVGRRVAKALAAS